MPPSVPQSHSPWCVRCRRPRDDRLVERAASEPNFVAVPKPCTPPPGPASQYPALRRVVASDGGALGGDENNDSGEYVRPSTSRSSARSHVSSTVA